MQQQNILDDSKIYFKQLLNSEKVNKKYGNNQFLHEISVILKCFLMLALPMLDIFLTTLYALYFLSVVTHNELLYTFNV